MTTAAPEPGPRAEPQRARRVAQSFGTDPARYDRARPRYPVELVDRVLASSPGHDVLDVGCGTGIVARQFRAAGARVLGVEPDARMAAFARGTGIEVEEATFEDWDPGDRAFDAVVAGQTWHWVDPDAGSAKAARVLRPGGRLAVFWNGFDLPTELGEAFAAVYRRVLPDTPFAQAMSSGPDAYAAMCDRADGGVRHCGGFADPQRWRFDWRQDYTRAEWLELLPTFGGHGLLPSAQRDELATGIGAAIDAVGGRFTMRYAAVVVTATRNGSA